MARQAFSVIMAGILAIMSGCATYDDSWKDDEGKTRVVVTIAPLESFVRAVGGDRVAVKCLCTTTGPHNYKPDTRDARVMGKADLVLAVGLTLDDHFADPMVKMVRRKDL